ncbi:MAG: hypothetical protein H0U85_05085 [Gemmatimonadales bacterium]|nr:hypothetical protein [Gemmatimonadales bacterium]
MLLIREVFHCKPGKVRALVEKFQEMSKFTEKMGPGRMRVMTDLSGERYWTVVAEMEVPNLQAYEEMLPGKTMAPEMEKEFGRIMEGYHDLVDSGRREMFRIEG